LTGDEQALAFNFIGLTGSEVNVSGKDEVNVSMNPDVTSLSEVVVVGYSSSGNSNTASTFEMAEPNGGRKSFKKYLETNLRYPEEALKNKVEGKSTVEFTVQPDGRISDFTTLKGLGSGCDQELIRLIKEGPSWKPSRKNSVAVIERVKVRLKFELPD
jgi:protein TonB